MTIAYFQGGSAAFWLEQVRFDRSRAEHPEPYNSYQPVCCYLPLIPLVTDSHEFG